MAASNVSFFGNNKLGPILWVLCFQFILVEYIVSLTTTFPYSYIDNYISDLGSTYCADLSSGFTDASRRVCSPYHDWLNAGFVVEGVLAAIGAFFMRKLLPKAKAISVALVLLYITGVGFAMAGFAPNDVNLPVHYIGAVFALFGGGIGMTVMGWSMVVQKSVTAGLAVFTLASGIISLAGTILLSSEMTLGIGVGGMERVAAYPYLIWLTLTGAYYLFGKAAAGHEVR